jgi:molecular chaperone GrpE
LLDTMSEQTTNDEATSATDEQVVEPVGDESTEPVDPLVAERDAALAQRDEYKDIALRLQADFENYRKRVAQQSADDIDRATGRIAEALLPVLDACEKAYVAHPAEVEPLFNLMLSELKKLGLEGMDLDGKPFDPQLSEAVMHEPGDGGESVVVDVLRSGYLWKGKVLRPAMVKVRG